MILHVKVDLKVMSLEKHTNGLIFIVQCGNDFYIVSMKYDFLYKQLFQDQLI